MPKAVKIAVLSLLALAGSTVAACGGKDTAPPVASPSFTASKERVGLGSPIDLTFQFDVLAPIPQDYKVLVHVVNPDGDTLWIDDHDPIVPTSQWKPGQKIQYTRQRFVPVVPFTGEATVRIGLYKGDERLPLQGTEPEQRTYKVGTLQLLPQSENVFLIYKTGWHQPEFSSDNVDEWQWTQKSGVVNFKNPRKDVTVYFDFDARADLFTPPQQVSIVIDGKPVQVIPADSTTRRLVKIPVTAAQLGDADMVELRVDVDKSFTIAQMGQGSDTRELGVRVFHVFVEPK